ncbi:MAG: class I SAM-dependent methyltransferase [Candidatus Brocadiia bacterium]
MKPKRPRKSRRASRARNGDAELAFSSDEVEAFWSRVAWEEYEDAHQVVDATHAQRFHISVPRLSLAPTGRLLNLWSRQGEAIPFIRQRFPDAELVNAEISRVMLRQAAERFPRETFVPCDLQSIDRPDDHFGAILSLETLEHSPSPQRLLDEMFRVLEPGGQLVLTCPSVASEVHLWVADHFLGNHGEGPHRFPSTLGVKRMLRRAGFRLVVHRATLFVPAELGGVLGRLNGLCERLLQWFPANELGIRQLYEARKPTGGARS